MDDFTNHISELFYPSVLICKSPAILERTSPPFIKFLSRYHDPKTTCEDHHIVPILLIPLHHWNRDGNRFFLIWPLRSLWYAWHWWSYNQRFQRSPWLVFTFMSSTIQPVIVQPLVSKITLCNLFISQRGWNDWVMVWISSHGFPFIFIFNPHQPPPFIACDQLSNWRYTIDWR